MSLVAGFCATDQDRLAVKYSDASLELCFSGSLLNGEHE